MTKKELTLSLIRFRMERAGVARGLSPGEAALMAEQRLRNEGMYGFMGGMKAAGTPEGAVVAITETFWGSVIPDVQRDAVMARTDDDSVRDSRMQLHIVKAINRIEAFRNRVSPGQPEYPHNLFDYVIYRVGIEVHKMHHIQADEMGLDAEVLYHMVETCTRYFEAKLS